MSLDSQKLLLVPCRVYLDTNHVINLTRIRAGRTSSIAPPALASYQRLLRWIKDGWVSLVYNRCLALEWVEAAAIRRNGQMELMEIAKLFDEAHQTNGVWEVDIDRVSYVVEVLTALGLDERLSLGPSMWQRGSAWSNAWKLAQYFDEWKAASGALPPTTSIPSFRDELSGLFQSVVKGRVSTHERIDGWRHAHAESRMVAQRYRVIDHRFFHEFVKSQLQVSVAIAPLLGSVDPRGLLSEIEPTDCPALWLYLRALWFYAREKEVAQDNDADDWTHVHGAILADLCLLEKGVTGYVRKADPAQSKRVFHRVEELETVIQHRFGCKGNVGS